MLVTVIQENIHHVLLVGALLVAQFTGLAVGVPLDGVEHLAATADFEDFVDLGERLLVQPAQGPGTVTHVDGRELAVNLLVVVVNPFPDGALLGVQFGFDQPRNDAVTRAENVLADDALQGQLLTALLALDEEAQLLRQRAKRLDHITRRIAPRTARTARHAFAAVPDRIAFEQLLDGVVVACLDDADDLPRIVVVELRRGADARTNAAVHARMKALLHPHVFHEHVEIFSHTYIQKNLCTAKVGNPPEPGGGINA